MFCKQCGKEAKEDTRFCSGCGQGLVVPEPGTATEAAPSGMKSFRLEKNTGSFSATIIRVMIIVGVVGLGAWASMDDDSVTSNNAGLVSYESGDNEAAIDQLTDASVSAYSDSAKLESLKNLGFVYVTDGDDVRALSTFKQALALAKPGSLDHYLLTAEIALLEGTYDAAYVAYGKAYQLDPDDFQVNTGLALLHLDLEDVAPEYVDYPKGLAYAKKSYAANPGEIARQNLGIAYFFNEDFSQAITLLLQSDLTKHPYIAAWLGLAYAGEENVSEAKRYMQFAIDKGVDVPDEFYDYIESN